MEQAHENWAVKVGGFARKVLAGAVGQMEKRYTVVKNRYGPRYTNAMLTTAFVAFILPLPGSALAGVVLVVVIAEIHRTISKRGFPEAVAGLRIGRKPSRFR